MDFVRQEVEQVLRRRKRGDQVLVIPALLGGESMPSPEGFDEPLRRALAPLCAIDAHGFSGGKQDDWEHQFKRLRDRIAAAPNAPRAHYRDRSGQPRPWHVIEHALAAKFQDPNQVLGLLRAQLQDGGGTAAVVVAGGSKAVALHGMGGIGKTQLALAYCHAYRDAYAGIWWLRAETAPGSKGHANDSIDPLKSPASRADDSLLQQDALAACAPAGVTVPDGVAPSQAFKQWLGGQTSPWLLVFDNADYPQALRPHLPGLGPHHVIITSRRPDWGGLAQTVELTTWTPEQGADFLVQRLGEGAAVRADAEALSAALGGLPLAMEQAASYLEANGGTVVHYMELWRGAAAELLNKHSASTGYELAVGATLSLAFKHLSPAAKQLLRVCAFAAPEPLPERFFIEGHEVLKGELAVAAAKPLAWDEVVGELWRYALARRSSIPSLDRPWEGGRQAAGDGATELALTFHRLTQQVVQRQLAVVQQDAIALLILMNHACPLDVHNHRDWRCLQALFPHAVMLNAADASVFGCNEATTVQRRAKLLSHASGFLQLGLALYPQALALEEQALALHRRVLGEDHPDTLTLKSNLASTLQKMGDLDRACELQEGVLADRRRVMGEDHPETVTSMSNLANSLREQGDLDGARELQEQVLADRRRVQGEDHPHTLNSMNNLAMTFQEQGYLVAARGLQERQLAASRQGLGEHHPATVASAHNLATMLHAQGDLLGARVVQEQVLADQRRVLGNDHPDTLSAMNNLAVTLLAQGDPGGAHDLQAQGLEARCRLLGENHVDTLTAMSNLAMTLQARGDLMGARDLQEKVLAVLHRILSDEHSTTLGAMNNLATTLQAQGDFDGARDLQEQALSGLRRVLGQDHPTTLAVMNNLAMTMWRQNLRDDAIELMGAATEGCVRALGAEHLSTKQSARTLAGMRAA